MWSLPPFRVQNVELAFSHARVWAARSLYVPVSETGSFVDHITVLAQERCLEQKPDLMPFNIAVISYFQWSPDTRSKTLAAHHLYCKGTVYGTFAAPEIIYTRPFNLPTRTHGVSMAIMGAASVLCILWRTYIYIWGWALAAMYWAMTVGWLTITNNNWIWIPHRDADSEYSELFLLNYKL